MTKESKSSDIVLAISGASGSAYGVRLLQVLLQAGRNVQLTISPAATRVFAAELKQVISLEPFDLQQLLPGFIPGPGMGQVVYHDHRNYGASIASGSCRTAGMVICPCSMGTLAAISQGLSTNLIQRAADVHLKERRKLIVVPRETPLGTIQLENMHRLSLAGAVILPAMPGFYHQPSTIADLVDFVVARICDQLGVEVQLSKRWGEPLTDGVED